MIDRGYTLPTPRRGWSVRTSGAPRATASTASIIVDEGGTTVPLRQAIRELVEDLTPIAARLGCIAELHGTLDILERGPELHPPARGRRRRRLARRCRRQPRRRAAR